MPLLYSGASHNATPIMETQRRPKLGGRTRKDREYNLVGVPIETLYPTTLPPPTTLPTPTTLPNKVKPKKQIYLPPHISPLPVRGLQPLPTTLPSDLTASNIPYEPTGKGNMVGNDPSSWTPKRFQTETLGGSVPSVSSSLLPAMGIVGIVLVLMMIQKK